MLSRLLPLWLLLGVERGSCSWLLWRALLLLLLGGLPVRQLDEQHRLGGGVCRPVDAAPTAVGRRQHQQQAAPPAHVHVGGGGFDG